jgi:hypothetical protein
MTDDTYDRPTTTNLTSGRKPPRTTCKICWCSVFESDKTIWVTTPSPGIAHKECAEQEE